MYFKISKRFLDPYVSDQRVQTGILRVMTIAFSIVISILCMRITPRQAVNIHLVLSKSCFQDFNTTSKTTALLDLTVKMCPPFLPALFHPSHPLSALNLTVGYRDKGRLPPPGLVTLLSPHPVMQVATKRHDLLEAATPPLLNMCMFLLLQLERRKQQLRGNLLCNLQMTPAWELLHKYCSQTELGGHFANI